MNIDKNRIPTKLLWVDLEMTGLNAQTDVILEVAAIVTDMDFRVLGSYESVIHQPNDKLDAMTDWPRQQHGRSGLTDRVRTATVTETEVVAELTAFISQHFGDEPAILAGNSIHNDRIFIHQWWPQVEALLHYRMLDVSSFKILMQGKYGVNYEKSDNHRAQGDIQESIDELVYYLRWLKTSDLEKPAAAKVPA